MCAQPSPQALQHYRRMSSLPAIAMHSMMLETTGASCSREQILVELRSYRDQCVSSLRDRIELVINSVEWMGSGGETQLYTFVFSHDGKVLTFVGIAVQQNRGLFDYTKYVNTYERQSDPNGYTVSTADFYKYGYVPNQPGMKTSIIIGASTDLLNKTGSGHNWNQPFTNDIKDIFEACFIFQLVKMGAAKITAGNRLALMQK